MSKNTLTEIFDLVASTRHKKALFFTEHEALSQKEVTALEGLLTKALKTQDVQANIKETLTEASKSLESYHKIPKSVIEQEPIRTQNSSYPYHPMNTKSVRVHNWEREEALIDIQKKLYKALKS